MSSGPRFSLAGLERACAQEGRFHSTAMKRGVNASKRYRNQVQDKLSSSLCRPYVPSFPSQDFRDFMGWCRSSPPRGWSQPPPCTSRGSSAEQNSPQGPRFRGVRRSPSPPKPTSGTARKPPAPHARPAPLLTSFCTFSPSTLAPSPPEAVPG